MVHSERKESKLDDYSAFVSTKAAHQYGIKHIQTYKAKQKPAQSPII